MSQIQHLWKKPTNRDPLSKPEVSWIELFFDLIFVAAFYNLSHFLGYHLDMSHFIQFTILSIVLFIAWWYYIAYQNFFENNDLSNRVFTFIAMFFIICMIVFIDRAFTSQVVLFSSFYIALRILYMCMWVRSGIHNLHIRATANIFTIFGVVSILLWFGGAYNEEYRNVLWLSSLILDLGFPVLLRTTRKSFSYFNRHHMPERLATFIIMVIGELLLSMIIGFSGIEVFSSQLLWGAFLTLFIIFGIWWIYFENIATGELSDNINKRIAWFHLHIPLYFIILMFSAGITAAFKYGFESKVPSLIIGFCLGFFFILAALLQQTLRIETQGEKRAAKVYLIVGIGSGIMTLIVSIFNYFKYNENFVLPLFTFVSFLVAIYMLLTLYKISECSKK